MPLGFQRLSGKGVRDQVIAGLWSTSAMWHVHRVSPVAMEAFDDIKITLSLSFMGPSWLKFTPRSGARLRSPRAMNAGMIFRTISPWFSLGSGRCLQTKRQINPRSFP